MTSLTRLRPVVQATRLPDGLHVRGWHSSFTMSGGDPVWRLWEHLERRLIDGLPTTEFTALAAASRAVGLIEGELRRHDMLVQVPADWAGATPECAPEHAVRSWLECVGDDPATAWNRLSGTTFAVLGAGPAAWAAHRALTDLGLAVTPGPDLAPDGMVRLAADALVVWAVCDDRAGAVLPPESAGCDAEPPASLGRLRDRLGITRVPPAATALTSLVGANAAHRLACAVAGLPDPAVERGAPRPGTTWQPPSVFVARLDPLRGDYHPWVWGHSRIAQPPRPAGTEHPATPAPAPASIDTDRGFPTTPWALDTVAAGRRLDALCDPETGPIERVLPADLPQVPAALAAFRHGAELFAASAPTFEVARLVAGRAVAQATLDETGTPAFAGIDEVEACGRALRAQWAFLPTGTPVPESDWASHPAARRWLKVLTLNFERVVEVTVDRLATGVHRARIDLGNDRTCVAVEAHAGDAVAFAALAAAGELQLEEAGIVTGRAVETPCGATPVASTDDPVWPEDAWTWPARPRQLEATFQAALGVLSGGRRLALRPVEPARLRCFAVTHPAVTVLP